MKAIKDAYLEAAGSGNSRAIVIVGSSASMIRTLTAQMNVWALDHNFDDMKIRGMWGANQHEEWNKVFLSDPNYDYGIDALLFTHFIQAGLSIENDSFFLKFMLFPVSYIDHGLEYQLSNRLREPVPALAYIEPGRKYDNEKGVKELTAKYRVINSYNWPDYQLETFAEAECEHRDTIYFHVEKWEQRSRLQGNFKFDKLAISHEPLKLEEDKILAQHIDCAQGLQKRIYNNLLFRSGCIPVEIHNTQEEIQRVIHWDTIASEKTIKSLTKHSKDPGNTYLITEFDAQFIMALCNEKDSTYITKPNLTRITGTSHNLCITLDYLLSL